MSVCGKKVLREVNAKPPKPAKSWLGDEFKVDEETKRQLGKVASEMAARNTKRSVGEFFSFSGRAPRSGFWWIVLSVIVLVLIGAIGFSALGMPMGVGMLCTYVVIMAFSLPLLVRRAHDLNVGGWLIAIMYIASAFIGVLSASVDSDSNIAGLLAVLGGLNNIAWLVVLGFLPGTVGVNKYGEDPLLGGPIQFRRIRFGSALPRE